MILFKKLTLNSFRTINSPHFNYLTLYISLSTFYLNFFLLFSDCSICFVKIDLKFHRISTDVILWLCFYLCISSTRILETFLNCIDFQFEFYFFDDFSNAIILKLSLREISLFKDPCKVRVLIKGVFSGWLNCNRIFCSKN